MYLPRALQKTFQQALASFPALLITGPRQSGKTTFLKQSMNNAAHYISFDDPMSREFALTDPNGFLDQFHDEPVILDEIQYVPELLSYLKIRIDQHPESYGQWLLTGSQQFRLMHQISESLAGRIAIMELLPFSLTELHDRALAETVWHGGYPTPSLHPDRLHLWVNSYIQTYLERDVRQLIQVHDLRRFEMFINLCAARHGQTFQAAALARDAGVSQPTIKSWISVLEAAYTVRLVAPWFRNYGKRLVKTPKLYFIDTALACALTRQPSADAALSGAMGGALFEGLIVCEAIKAFTQIGRKPEVYYWRTRDGMEVDLLIVINGLILPVEIKLTATPTANHLQPLTKLCQVLGDDIRPTGLLVCRCKQQLVMAGGHIAMPWENFSLWLQNALKVSPA